MRLISCSVLLLLPLGTHALAQVQFTPLGTLPGDRTSEAWDISADGTIVVGTSFEQFWRGEPFRWTAATGMVGLGGIPGGHLVDEAFGISGDGSTIVGSGSPNPSTTNTAFAWTQSGGYTLLGNLPGGQPWSEAMGANHDGSVIVGLDFDGNGNQSFRWTAAGGMVRIAGGCAEDVDASGSIVVGFEWAQGSTVAYRWTESTGAADFLGQAGSIAKSISTDGAVIVGHRYTPVGFFAFRWTATSGIEDIPGVAGLAALPSPSDVSADGSVVVGRLMPGTVDTLAMLWTRTLGTVDLRDYLLAQGATGLAGWTLVEATGVSADGTRIVGRGLNPNGLAEAWLVTLPPFPPLGSNYCGPANPNSTGQSATIRAAGASDVALGELRLTASALPPGQFGYFLVGRMQGAFQPPGSAGILCLAGNIGRYNRAGEIVQGPTGLLELDLDAFPVNPPAPVLPGDTWNFQCWFRDVGGTSNFTDGVMVMFL